MRLSQTETFKLDFSKFEKRQLNTISSLVHLISLKEEVLDAFESNRNFQIELLGPRNTTHCLILFNSIEKAMVMLES